MKNEIFMLLHFCWLCLKSSRLFKSLSSAVCEEKKMERGGKKCRWWWHRNEALFRLSIFPIYRCLVFWIKLQWAVECEREARRKFFWNSTWVCGSQCHILIRSRVNVFKSQISRNLRWKSVSNRIVEAQRWRVKIWNSTISRSAIWWWRDTYSTVWSWLFACMKEMREKFKKFLKKKLLKPIMWKITFLFLPAWFFSSLFFPPSHPSTASEISVLDESHGTHLKNIFPPSPKECG